MDTSLRGKSKHSGYLERISPGVGSQRGMRHREEAEIA